MRRDLRERDRHRRDRPEPPEPTKAPPVAPKPKPSPRGPPSVDDDHSEKGHPDSINDSFEDVHVPDRRSKIEKIHGVATPLSQVLQKSMEKADKSDHEDENSHGPPGYTPDHNEDRRHQVCNLSAISQNSPYLFSYPSSSVDSNLSDNCGDYDTCKPLKAHRNRTSSESHMSRSTKPAANWLHHSITDLPKAASESHEMIGSQEQIYAEIDALKGSYSSTIEPFSKSFGDTRAFQPKIYGRRSKHYTKNQKQSRPAMNAPNAQPSLQNVAMTDLLLDTPSSVSLAAINKPTPKYAKINKKPSFKQENPAQTNANDHLGTTKQKDYDVEYTPHSKIDENTLLKKNKEKIREEFKMYILSPQNQDNKETKTTESNSKVADKTGTLSNANKQSFQCVTTNTDVIEQSDCHNISENKSACIAALEKNETLKPCIDSDQMDHNYTVDGFDMERFETHDSRKPIGMDGESYNANGPNKESNYITPKFELQGHSKHLEEFPYVAKDAPSFATSENSSRYKMDTASDDNCKGLDNHVDAHMNERDKFGHSKHLDEFPAVAKDVPSFATAGNSSRYNIETASDDNLKGLENHVDAHMKERDKLNHKSFPESNAEESHVDAHMNERDKLYHKSIPESNAKENHSINDLLQGSELIEPVSVVSPEIVVSECDTEQGATGVTPDVSHYQIAFDSNMKLDSNGQDLDFDDQLEKFSTLSSCSSDMEITLQDRSKDVDNEKDTDRLSVSTDQDLDLERFSVLSDDSSDIEFKYGKKESANDMDLALEKYCGLSTDSSEGDCERFEICHHGPLLTVPYKSVKKMQKKKHIAVKKDLPLHKYDSSSSLELELDNKEAPDKSISSKNVKSTRSDPQLTLKPYGMSQTNSVPKAKALRMSKDPAPKTMSSGELTKSEKRQEVQLEGQKKNKNIIKLSEVSEPPKCNHIVGSSSSSASNIVGPERHDTQSELGTKGLLKKSKSKDRLGLSCVKMRTTSPFEVVSNPEKDIVVKESEKLEKPKSVYQRVTSQFSKPFVKKKSKSKIVDEENVLATLRDTDSTSDNLIPTDDKFKSLSPAMNVSEEPKNFDSMPRRRFNKPDWFKTYLLPEEQKSSTQIDHDKNDGLSGDVKSKDKCSIINAVQSDTYDSFPSNLSKNSSANPQPPVSKGVAVNKKQTVDVLADSSTSNQQTCKERTNLIKEPKAELSKIGLASRKKISPGVIHMLNPCSSGWLEGGLEAEVDQNKHVGYMPAVHCASEREGRVGRPVRDKTVKVSALDFDLTAVNVKSEIDESIEPAMQETKESVGVDAHYYPNTGPLLQNLKTMGEEKTPLEVSKVETSIASSKRSEKGTDSLEGENTATLSTIAQSPNNIVEDKLCQRKWKYKFGKPKIEGIELRGSAGLRINLVTEGNCDLLALKDNMNPEKLTDSEPLEDLDKSHLIKDEPLKEVVPRISELEIDEQSRKAINVYKDVSIDRIERRIIIDNSCKLIEKKSLSGKKGTCFEKDLISADDSKLNVLDKQKTSTDKADQCSNQHKLFPEQMVDKNCDVTKEDNNNGANINKDIDDNNDAAIEVEVDINQIDDGMNDNRKNVNKDNSGSENECYFTSLTDVSVLQDSNMHDLLDDDDIPYADDDHCQDTSGSDISVLAGGLLAKTLILETGIDTSGSNISVLESGLLAKTLFSEPKTSRSEISVITCRPEVEHDKATPCSLSNGILCECNFHSPKYSESDSILTSVDKGTIPNEISITDNRKESLESSESVNKTKSQPLRLPFTEDGLDAVQLYIPDQLPCTKDRLCPEELASNTNVILCECNFRPVIVTDLDGASWYEEDDDIETICSYTDDKVPIIIEDSPFVPKKRILKPSFSAENILNPGPKKGVRFHSNLPTWKKRSWRSESNLRRRFNKVKDSEEEKKKHIENFIMCMFEQEPRNLALMGEAVGRNDYSDSIAESDMISKSDSKERRTVDEQELSLNSYTSFIQHKRNTDVINFEEILGDDEKGSNLESFGSEENGDGCFGKSHLENPRKDTDKSQSDTDLMNIADKSITHHSYNNDSPAHTYKAKKSPTIAKQFKPNSPKIFVPVSYKSSLSASESVAKYATTSASAESCLNYDLNDPAYVATGGTKLDILSDSRSDHTYSEINDKNVDDDNECQLPENENFQVADIHEHHHSDENKTKPLLDWKTYLKSYQIFKSKIHRPDTKFSEDSKLKKEFGSNTVLNPNRDTYADVSFLGAKIEENWNQIEKIPSKEKNDDIRLLKPNENITPQENTRDLNPMKMKEPLPQTRDVFSVPTDCMITEDFKKGKAIEIVEATFEKEKAKSKAVISDNPSTLTGKTTRYVCTIPDETDPDSPKIKSVTYEYVTEYRLNNVKVDYQYNKQVQTENT